MIQSMTAYSKHEIKKRWGSAIWEIRSLNHRYLEINFRLPDQFRNFESIMRNKIRSNLVRGKIECNLHFEIDLNNQEEELIFNKKLAQQIINAANWIKSQNNNEGEINLIDILHWPGIVVITQKKNMNIISSEILLSFEETLKDLILERKKEGQELKKLIKKRLKNITKEIKKVRFNIPEILQWQRNRLISKLDDVTIQLEKNRLEQELIFIAQRMDISEEIDRLEVHVKDIFNILKKNEAVGRRLDFMMQELNRESNTLSSKSIKNSITNSAIELKVLIEQMREQIQNIE